MAIKSIIATVNNEEYTLTWSEANNRYEVTVTAPNISTNSELVPEGYFPVSITATDTANNSTTITAEDEDKTFSDKLKLFVKELNKPTILVTSPSQNAYYTSGTINLEFRVYDDRNGQTTGFSGVDKDTIKFSYAGNEYTPESIVAVDGGYKCTGSVTLIDGEYTFSFNATDKDGNEAETVTRAFVIDTGDPELTNIEINGSTEETIETNVSEITITGTTNDATSKPVTVAIKVNDVDSGDVTVEEDGTFSKTINLSRDDTYVIVITATDKATNSISVTRTVIYNTTAPRFISVDIIDNPATAGATYTIAVKVE